MNTQKKFKDLMEKLADRPLADLMGEANSRKALEDSCLEIQKALLPTLAIDIENGNEPFPFCYSGGNRKAELVWVGLNPGAPLERCKTWSWKKASWKDIIDYCVPHTDIRDKDDDSTYATFLDKSKKELETDYYRFVLRMQMALLDDEVYDTWKQVQEKCKKNKREGYEEESTTAKLFLNRFATKPVLTAEMIPYKSKGMQFAVKNLLDNPRYKAYFRTMIEFIESISVPDAWIIFFGAPKEIRILLEQEYPEWNIAQKIKAITIPEENGQEFNFFNIKKHPVMLSPFIKRYSVNYHIEQLIKVMKHYKSHEILPKSD